MYYGLLKYILFQSRKGMFTNKITIDILNAYLIVLMLSISDG